MKTVKLEDLIPGTIVPADYRTEAGEILLSKGVIITESHIEILKRRNILELYIHEITEEEEIKRLISSDYKLDNLELGDECGQKRQFQNGTDSSSAPQGNRAKALDLPEFRGIKGGAEGLEQLNKSPAAVELDKKIKSGHTSDRPVGPGLKLEAREMKPASRDVAYKNSVTSLYNDILARLKGSLKALADGEKISSAELRRISEQLVKQFITDKNILLNLSMTENKDTNYIFTHTLNVCLLVINIAAAYGYSKEQVIEIGMGALVHDVGMLLIPQEIYLKKGRITKDEFYEIQKHPILGLHLLENISRLPDSVPYMAYQSHERENGTGYPKRRSDRLIHFFSKIIQIADIYIALCSPRPYREAYIPYKAMETIIKMTKQGLVSGELVKSLLQYTSLFPVGSLVELSNKRVAKVIEANNTSFAKPVVSVLTDEHGALLPPKQIYQINLYENTEVSIAKALKSEPGSQISLMDGF